MFPVAFWTKTKHEGDNPIQLSVTIPKYCFWVEMTEEERKRTENTEGGEKKKVNLWQRGFAREL